jgi:hypothetical protein
VGVAALTTAVSVNWFIIGCAVMSESHSGSMAAEGLHGYLGYTQGRSHIRCFTAFLRVSSFGIPETKTRLDCAFNTGHGDSTADSQQMSLANEDLRCCIHYPNNTNDHFLGQSPRDVEDTQQ